VVVDALLFSVFALHHSLFARTPAKAWLARWWPERLLRSVYVWVASALLMLVCMAWRPVGGIVYQASRFAALALWALQLTGLWLIVQSVRAIHPLELAGISRVCEPSRLQITGPYRLVRHPLYLGWMLIVFCAPHLTGDRLAFAAISSFYLILAIPWEERSLQDTFGQSYVRYKQHVRWRVVPYVY
jgi:protein-S-isoprenylcysteine O-methyltransferase Ste14